MVIDLTSSEKSTFSKFLFLYLGSSLILMIFVGFFYFQQEKRLYLDLKKSKLQNLVTNISSEIIISHMQNYSFNKDIYIDSQRYEGSFAKKKNKYLNSKDYKIAFYDEDKKFLFGSFNEKLDLTKKTLILGNDIIIVDNSAVGHLGIGYIAAKDNSLEQEIKTLKINIFLMASFIYLIIAIIGFYLSKLFLKPLKDERLRINKFIKDTSHELNTPITALLMSTENEKLSEKQIQRIRLSANRISEIYKDISYVFLENKKIKQKTQNFDLKDLIAEQIEFFEPLISRKNITLKKELDSFTYTINKDDFIRLFNNLLSNAIKYNKTNGEIEVILKDRSLIIKDTGIGINKKDQKDIFKRYFRATSEQGGFGIGLNIVNEICTSYNIEIKVISKEEKGSSFILNF